MGVKTASWDTHVWDSRRIEIDEGYPLIQHTCRICTRTFVTECSSENLYAVHVGMTRFDKLSEETTAHWLNSACPGQRPITDDADLTTRFLGSDANSITELAASASKIYADGIEPVVSQKNARTRN
jgi:hypothetical protein